MPLSDDLVDHYKKSLLSTGVVITDDGYVHAETESATIPVTVTNDEILVLPTAERLKEGNWKGLQAYHPLSENSLRGESIVLKKLRVLMAARITHVLESAMGELVRIAADTKLHPKLSPKASEFLSFVKQADQKTLSDLSKIISKVTLLGDHRLVSFYFRRPGEQGKGSFTRQCVVDFPILDELGSKEYSIFGVKVRKADKANILFLFEWLLVGKEAGSGEDHSAVFSTGTTSMMTPYYYTLSKTYCALADALNTRLALFKKTIPDVVKELHIDTSWAEDLDSLEKWRDVIPSLRGNEGAVPTHPGSKKQREDADDAPVNIKGIAIKPKDVNVGIGSSGTEEDTRPVEDRPAVTPPTQPFSSKWSENQRAERVHWRDPSTPPAPPAEEHRPTPSANGKVKWGDVAPSSPRDRRDPWAQTRRPQTVRQAAVEQQRASRWDSRDSSSSSSGWGSQGGWGRSSNFRR